MLLGRQEFSLEIYLQNFSREIIPKLFKGRDFANVLLFMTNCTFCEGLTL